MPRVSPRSKRQQRRPARMGDERSARDALPNDRHHAPTRDRALPGRARGAARFADIGGITRLTLALVRDPGYSAVPSCWPGYRRAARRGIPRLAARKRVGYLWI